jgi:general secretion pathway protein E
VEDYLLAATLKGVLAQRLVRRLCPVCKLPEKTPLALIERFSLERLAPNIAELPLYRPVGCAECRGTGYRGRRAIAELLLPSPTIDRLIFERGDHSIIEQAAMADGMRPIFDAGLLAVLEGDTTIQEVTRCITGEA